MDTKEILVAEDEPAVVESIRAKLEARGEFRIRVAPTADDVLKRIADAVPHALLLDTTLPDLSAQEVCRMIRSRTRTERLACIMLGQPTRGLGLIEALACGADDYVSKPVDVGELEARLRAVLRRRLAPPPSAVLRFQGVRIDADFTAVRVSVDGKKVSLTRREFVLLRAFVEQPGSILSRTFLLHSVWTEGVRDPRVVDSAIWKLRQKLGEAGCQIETINGFGYRFNEPRALC
jgi:DNA-binding response OmpR family regulator